MEGAKGYFSGRTYLVTGGSRGIGFAVASSLLESGATVLLHHRKPGEGVKRLKQKHSGRVIEFASELSSAEGISSLVEWASTYSLDGIVNNAGVYQGESIEETTYAVWNETLTINLAAPFFIVRGLKKNLLSSRGSVVNISSIMGVVPSAGAFAYQSSKAALIHLTKSLALELAPSVRVNCIAPGFVRTDMNRDGWTDREFQAAVEKATPAGRWGETEDIAHPVLFLLSPLASFITGQCLLVDGGKSLSFL